VSEPYYDDEVYDDDESAGFDPETLAEMQTAHEQAEAAAAEVYDRQLAETELRWEEEDRERAEQEHEQRIDAVNEATVSRFIVEAANAAGLETLAEQSYVYALAEGLITDPDFQREHPGTGAAQVQAAIAEAVKMAAPPGDEDEVAAASRIMARRQAQERFAQQNAGVVDTSGVEGIADAFAAVGGLNKQETADFRKALGLPEGSR
jgi:hypothetical protein